MATPLSLLHAEDSEEDALLTVELLREGGFDVSARRVETEAAMRDALHAQRWDIILSDFSMPGFDGLAALSIRNELAPGIPFIIVSGTIGEEMAVSAMRAGAQDYLLKGHMARLAPAVRREVAEAENRKAAEESERKTREIAHRLNLVAQATNDVIYDWDIPKNKAWMSDRLKATFGYAPGEGALTLEWWLERVHPGDRARVDGQVKGTMESRSARCDLEYRFQHADGSWKWVIDRGHLMYARDGAPSRWIGSMMDVTDRKALEQQYLQSQKMESVGRLAGGIAHDFNNLLTVINGYSELLLAETGADSPARAELEEIFKAGTRASGLTRQLLAFSRKQVTERSNIDVNKLIAGLQKMLDRLVGENIQLVFTPAPGELTVLIDPGQLEQVLLNLVVNARDAMPHGGRISIVTALDSPGDPGARGGQLPAPGPAVRISVADTGTGISDHVLTHLFEPFFTTKDRGKGTGLGLSTVHGIVTNAGGSIRVDTAVGSGSVFHVLIPRSEEGPAPAKSTAVPAASSRETKTVLVAEDLETVQRLIRSVLEHAGYTVLSASSGSEALRVAESHVGPIDLLLTDVVMRSMSGPELAGIIRREHPETRVLFMSGYTDLPQEEIPESAMLLPKPFSLEALRTKVREAIASPQMVAK